MKLLKKLFFVIAAVFTIATVTACNKKTTKIDYSKITFEEAFTINDSQNSLGITMSQLTSKTKEGGFKAGANNASENMFFLVANYDMTITGITYTLESESADGKPALLFGGVFDSHASTTIDSRNNESITLTLKKGEKKSLGFISWDDTLHPKFYECTLYNFSLSFTITQK